ncbi:MAG TPA: GspH/FimT family pseudopilin [Halomonas sp.]|nr:GspH/FimT family pseudopilin [Halomonas sp.]
MQRDAGFTLIELLVTLAVAIIIMTIAVPSFQGLMTTSRLAGDYNEILSGLNLARSEAIKRRESVSFEIISDSPWEYRVYLTDAGNSEENALRVRKKADTTITVSDASIVVFGPLGKIDDGTDCDGSCSIEINHSTVECKAILVSSFGRVARDGGCADDN